MVSAVRSGCRPYAEAVGLRRARKSIVAAPGGEAVMLKWQLLNVEPQPCDGEEQQAALVRALAVIDENNRIGCTKCIQARPVDAIVGATRAMHTVMSDPTRLQICASIRVRRTASNYVR